MAKTLPSILAENPALAKAARAAQVQVQTAASTAPTAARPSIQREADKLRQAIAEARVIATRGGRR